MANRRKSTLYKTAFRNVMSSYTEIKSVLGTLSCTSLYKSIGRQGFGKAGFNSSVVRAYPVDLVSDVEIIARTVLDNTEQIVFNQYTSGDRTCPNVKEHIKEIQEKLGAEFIVRKLHPIELYFKPRDIR